MVGQTTAGSKLGEDPDKIGASISCCLGITIFILKPSLTVSTRTVQRYDWVKSRPAYPSQARAFQHDTEEMFIRQVLIDYLSY